MSAIDLKGDHETLEQQIRRKGLSAPRVTPADIEAAIACRYFVNAADAVGAAPVSEHIKLLTLCILVLQNGFTVVGKSACASPENYDREVGERVALDDAKRQLWPLLGYALREKLGAAE